jgi:hypothetical protein
VQWDLLVVLVLKYLGLFALVPAVSMHMQLIVVVCLVLVQRRWRKMDQLLLKLSQRCPC